MSKTPIKTKKCKCGKWPNGTRRTRMDCPIHGIESKQTTLVSFTSKKDVNK